MKGQAYILKRVHLEREELLNYHHHKERIKKIKPVITQDLDIKQKNMQKNQAHRYHHNALKFRQQQEKIQVQIKNDILCNKLKEIGYGKYTIKRQMGFPEQQIKKNQSLEKQRSISTLQKRSKLNTIYNEQQSLSNNKTFQQIEEHNYENDQIQEFENENDNEYENDQYEQDFEQDDQVENQVYQTQSENKNNQNQIKQTNFQKQQQISQFPINQSHTGKIRVKRTTSEQPHDKNFPSFNKKAQFFKNNNQTNTFKNIYNNQKSVDLNMNKNKNMNNNSKTFDQQELENEFYNGTPELYKKNQTNNNRYNNDINKNDSNLVSNKNNENIESYSNNFHNNNIQQESQQQLPVFKSARNGIKNQFSDSPQKKRAARSHSSHLNHVQKLQQIRIQIENKHIALRVLNQGPSIKVKKLESDFKDHKKKLSQLKKFHEKITLKPPQYSFRNPKDQRAKQEISVDRKEFYMFENDQDEFFDTKIDLKVKIHEIIFNSTLFQKFSKETDNFYYETYLPSLKTLKSENFVKIQNTVKQNFNLNINFLNTKDFEEFQRQELQFQIPLKDLFTSSLLIIQLIQKTGENPPKSHGDIEINLKEIFDFNETFTLSKELRNWKEFRYLPNYYSKNMRSKGQIKYTFHIKSNIKQKVEEQLKIYQENQLQAQQKLQEMQEQQPQMQQAQKTRKQSRSKTKRSKNNSVYKLEKISQQQLKYQIQDNNSATIQNNQQDDKQQDQTQIQQQNKEKEQNQHGLTFQSNSETKDQKQEQKQIQEQHQQLTQQQNLDIQKHQNEQQNKQQDKEDKQEKELSTYQNPIKNEIKQSQIQDQSQQDKQALNQSIESQYYSQNFSFVSPQKESENQTQSIKQQSLYQSQNKQNQTQSSHEKSKAQSQKKNIIKKQTQTQNQPENNNKSSFHKKNTNLNNNDTISIQNSNPQELNSSNKTNLTQKQIQEKQQQLQKQSLEQSLQESQKNKNQQLKSQQSKRSVNYKEDYESQFDDYMSENNEIV